MPYKSQADQNACGRRERGFESRLRNQPLPRAESKAALQFQGGVPDSNPIGGSLAVHKIGTWKSRKQNLGEVAGSLPRF